MKIVFYSSVSYSVLLAESSKHDFGINNENIPVELVQGTLDGIGAQDEVEAAIKVLDRPSELIPNPGPNPYFSNLNYF